MQVIHVAVPLPIHVADVADLLPISATPQTQLCQWFPGFVADVADNLYKVVDLSVLRAKGGLRGP